MKKILKKAISDVLKPRSIFSECILFPSDMRVFETCGELN